MLQLASRATKLALLFFITLAIYGCGAVDDDFTSNTGATSASPNSSAQILARLGPAAQVPNVTGGDFTRMPFHGFKAITPDGRYVLFLAKGTNDKLQLYRRDLQDGVTLLISQTSGDDNIEGDGDTTYGAISTDGTKIAFASESANLDAEGNPDGYQQVLIRDLSVMPPTTSYAANDAPGISGVNSATPNALAGDSIRPSISGDGTKVVFESRNQSITQDDTLINIASDRDALRARIVLVDVASGEASVIDGSGFSLAFGGDAPGGSVFGDNKSPDISRDGRWVVFDSAADDLPGAGDGRQHIYRRDIVTLGAAVEHLSAGATRSSFNPTVNADGSMVAFETLGALGGASDEGSEIIVWTAPTTTPAAAATTKVISKDASFLASISDDGNFVGFVSTALDLVEPALEPTTVGPKPNLRTFVHRLDTSLTAVVGRTSESNIGNGSDVLGTAAELQALNSEVGACEGDTAISGDGSVIAYTSYSTNLGPEVTGQTTANQSVFVSPNPLFGGTINFTQQPTSLGDGQTFSPDIQVEVRNDFGIIDTGFNGPVSLAVSGGGDPALSGTTTVNAVNGLATFPGIGLTGIGATALTLTASAGGDVGFEEVASTPFDFTAADPLVATTITFGTQPQNTALGIGFPSPVTVEVLDQNNNVLTTDQTTSITLTLLQPAMANFPGTLTGTPTQTVSSGVATFDGLSINDESNVGYSLRASATGAPVALADVDSNTFDVARRPSVVFYIGDTVNNLLSFRFPAGFGIISNPAATNLSLTDAPTDLLAINGFAYVSTAGNQLLVLNTSQAIVQTFTLGGGANNRISLALNDNQDRLFVTNKNSNQLTAYRIDAGLLTEINPATGADGSAPLTLDSSGPNDIVFSNGQLFIANETNTLSIYDFDGTTVTANFSSPFTIPVATNRVPTHLVARNGQQGESSVYLSSPLSSEILQLTVTGNGPFFEQAFTTGGSSPGSLLLRNAGDAFLYVALSGSQAIETWRIDLAMGGLTSLGTVDSLGANPQSFAEAFINEGSPGFPMGGNALYVTTANGLTGFVINNGDGSLGMATEFSGNTGNTATSYTNGGPMDSDFGGVSIDD